MAIQQSKEGGLATSLCKGVQLEKLWHCQVKKFALSNLVQYFIKVIGLGKYIRCKETSPHERNELD